MAEDDFMLLKMVYFITVQAYIICLITEVFIVTKPEFGDCWSRERTRETADNVDYSSIVCSRGQLAHRTPDWRAQWIPT